jgi:hypothetical protein
MTDLCQLLASTDLLYWQELYIEWEMINVRLDITSIDTFRAAICDMNFLDMELRR